jgi:alpha-amylase/alpha-mannosidase (GH57 family)
MSIESITTIPLSLKRRGSETRMEMPAGAVITWLDGKATATWWADGEAQKLPISALSAAKGLGKEIPDTDQLTEWVHDSMCESILGENVEPDGIDEHGSPSWLLAMGMI